MGSRRPGSIRAVTEPARKIGAREAAKLLHVDEAGSGAPVLLVHGLNASSHVFAPLVEQARSRHRLISVDLPCSGGSGDWCEFDPVKLADGLAELMRERRIPAAVVVGHSYGGVVATELLARHPRRVKGLVVIAAPALGLGKVGPLLSTSLAERLWSRTGAAMRSPKLVRTWLRYIRGTPEGLTDALVDRYMQAMAHERHMAVTLDALRSLARYRLPVDTLRALKTPRAVIWGDRDRLVPIFQGEQVAHALGVPLTLLHEVGHCVPEERPDAVLAAIDGIERKRRNRANARKVQRGRSKSAG